MKLFDVYPLLDVTPVKGEGAYIWDKSGQRYLDFYGGHAVISIGHHHPTYANRLQEQLSQIGFYSNAVHNNLQTELATKLGELSGYDNYRLFLCNSGAEANENALKLASFHNNRRKIIAFKDGFHGRTSLAVGATDNPKIRSAVNTHDVIFMNLNDAEAVTKQLANQDVCAVIIEGIQGIGGIVMPTNAFLQDVQKSCQENGTLLILDEVQSGYGRSGKFFAHQHAGITPDLITVAKGMGNGFPMGGVLISPKFKASYGLLGTTFGGNHLACAAGIAVLEVLKTEKLLANAETIGTYLKSALQQLPGVTAVRGQGLMIGLDLTQPAKIIRGKLLTEQHVFTGSSAAPKALRLLPPLTITKDEADSFLKKLHTVLTQSLN